MTREEIEKSLNILKEQALKSHNDTAILDVKVESFVWVIESAIKALSQEPCDDAISRILKRMWNCRGKHTTSIDKVKMEQIIRDELPSVTQKSGKWILLDECANSGYYCSECQKKLVKEGWSKTVKKIKYCPNCGARMESEDKE